MLSAVFHGYNLYKMKGEGGVVLGQKRATRERKLWGQCPLFFAILPCDPQVICVKVQYAVLSKSVESSPTYIVSSICESFVSSKKEGHNIGYILC